MMGITRILLKRLDIAPTKKELGSFIALYSIWFKHQGDSASKEGFIQALKERKGKRAKRAGVLWALENEEEALKASEILRKHFVKKEKIKEGYKASYRDYLESDGWKQRRRDFIKRTPYCALCGVKHGLLVHHLTYKSLGSEKDKDIVVMCNDCHNFLHRKYGRGASFGLMEIEQEKNKRERKKVVIGNRYIVHFISGEELQINEKLYQELISGIKQSVGFFMKDGYVIQISQIVFIKPL